MKIEVHGLEMHGHHGVLPAEKENGQTFWYDVELDVGGWGTTDRIEDAVDYRRVADVVTRINALQFELLEALASTIADSLIDELAVARVKVRVRKRPPGMNVEYTAVTAERP